MTLGVTFQNQQLDLLDAGTSQERYRFSIVRDRMVNMTGSIGEQNGAFNCDFGSTNLQGLLYTKMQKTYPPDTVSMSAPPNPQWPFGEY